MFNDKSLYKQKKQRASQGRNKEHYNHTLESNKKITNQTNNTKLERKIEKLEVTQ